MNIVKTRRNHNSFNEFVFRNPDTELRIEDWYDGIDHYDILVILQDGRACLYDNHEKTERWAASVDDLIRVPIDENEWAERFSYNLYKRMRHTGFKQKDLAEQTGISEASIANYVNGKYLPNIFRAKQLAEALNCSVDELTYF